MTDLIFDRPPLPGPPWPLVFGDDGGDAGIATLYGTALLPGIGLQGASHAGPPPTVHMDGQVLTGIMTLALAGRSIYAGNVARPIINRNVGHWQIADALDTGASMRHQQAQPHEAGNAPRWQDAQPLPVPLEQTWAETQHTIRPWATLPHQDAQRLGATPLTQPHQQADTGAHWLGLLPHQEGIRLPTGTVTHRQQDGIRDRRYLGQTRHQQAQPLQWAQSASAGAAITLAPGVALRYQAAMRPPAGIWLRPIDPPVSPPCYVPSTLLVFSGPLSLDGLLFFVCEREDGTGPQPGQTIVIPSSATMLLGAPYMSEQSWLNAQDASAQQLVIDALQYTGVDVDWQITDWLVGAGAWSFTGTPLAAALRVAQSVGAVVQSDRVAPILRFLPRYPLMPWEWSWHAKT